MLPLEKNMQKGRAYTLPLRYSFVIVSKVISFVFRLFLVYFVLNTHSDCVWGYVLDTST